MVFADSAIDRGALDESPRSLARFERENFVIVFDGVIVFFQAGKDSSAKKEKFTIIGFKRDEFIQGGKRGLIVTFHGTGFIQVPEALNFRELFSIGEERSLRAASASPSARASLSLEVKLAGVLATAGKGGRTRKDAQTNNIRALVVLVDRSRREENIRGKVLLQKASAFRICPRGRELSAGQRAAFGA
ncbi:MAG: hypothetical protein HC888_05615 [Candidatus Competibacteraceae bacterium]|nr:hypothetical protein [Candidatus Competibacteraceae bacterium]